MNAIMLFTFTTKLRLQSSIADDLIQKRMSLGYGNKHCMQANESGHLSLQAVHSIVYCKLFDLVEQFKFLGRKLHDCFNFDNGILYEIQKMSEAFSCRASHGPFLISCFQIN